MWTARKSALLFLLAVVLSAPLLMGLTHGRYTAWNQAAPPVGSKATVTLDRILYPAGHEVLITLSNTGQVPLTLPSASPWSVFNEEGELSYRPVAIQKLSTLAVGESKSWTWNQVDNDEVQAEPGLYTVVVRTSTGEVSESFGVSGLRSDFDTQKPEPDFLSLENPFKDVTGEVEWGDAHILRLTELGVAQGRTDDMFEPNSTLTRAEFVTLLLRASGLEPNEETHGAPFQDVPETHWSHNYVMRARNLGIVTRAEYRENFEPDRAVTRLEISIMLARTLGLDAEAMADAGIDLPFTDADEVPPLYRGYVKLALGLQVLKGYEDLTFRPDRNATRREACVILYRVLEEPPEVKEEL